jgi:hypothetical protein
VCDLAVEKLQGMRTFSGTVIHLTMEFSGFLFENTGEVKSFLLCFDTKGHQHLIFILQSDVVMYEGKDIKWILFLYGSFLEMNKLFFR